MAEREAEAVAEARQAHAAQLQEWEDWAMHDEMYKKLEQPCSRRGGKLVGIKCHRAQQQHVDDGAGGWYPPLHGDLSDSASFTAELRTTYGGWAIPLDEPSDERDASEGG
eukprot:s5757_g3.t1